MKIKQLIIPVIILLTFVFGLMVISCDDNKNLKPTNAHGESHGGSCH